MSFEARTDSIHDGSEPHPAGRPFRSTGWRCAGGLALAASLWWAAEARAQAGEPPAEALEPVAHVHGRPAGDDGGHDHARRHHLMVMAAPGVTDGGAGTFSTGLGYEYRLPFHGDLFGVGAMAEVMFMPAAHQMLMATVSIHPLDGPFLQAAVGVTHLHQDPTLASSGHMSSQAVVRLSAGYELHLGTLMLAPYASADLARRPRLAVAAGLCTSLMF